ncbi:hypothetical protein EYF80_053234 [Liparis tanakae]|uniref:Uncharacterized protein n=1 Tax=Liparis tanakae TaxID=230148 RepID=A0A4Z2F6U7_9TELE|nr:hypothetical protein EYF80_053234 [Liparis tanakae]
MESSLSQRTQRGQIWKLYSETKILITISIDYMGLKLIGAVKRITAGLLLPVVRVFQRNKPRGIGRPGIRGTITISAIIKEQLAFDPPGSRGEGQNCPVVLQESK